MSIVLNGTTGITTPDVTSDSYTGPLAVDASAPDDSLVVDASGNLGLGVTPSGWNNVFKALQINAQGSLMATSASMQMGNNIYYDGAYKFIGTGYANRYYQATGQHVWTVSTASGTAGGTISETQAMTLDQSGNLLVGTTSNPNVGKIGIAYTSSSQTGIVIKPSADTGTNAIQFLNAAGAQVGYISTTGSATSYTTSSDYRLKENWVAVADASTRVNALKPVNFAWKVDGSRVDGFLAHELVEVVPEAVTGEKDAMRDEEYEVTPAVLDDDGNVVTPAVMGTRSVPDYQGIDQSKLVPLLTAALQEALAKIDDLTARVSALEAV
jgi:hypothetical protein